MSKHKDLPVLFHETLKRHRAARRQGAKGLGRMADAATGPALSDALQTAREAAGRGLDLLDEVFSTLDRKPHEEACAVTDALLDEAKALVAHLKSGPALDVGLATAAEALEGHAAGRLAMLSAWAARMDLPAALPHLERLLTEALAARSRFAALVAAGDAPAGQGAVQALTPKQAALIGLR